MHTRVIKKSSMPHPERSVMAEYFCCGNTLPLLIKPENLIQISVLISVQVNSYKYKRLQQI